MNQVSAVMVVVLVALSGLVASNFLYDRGAPNSLPRRAAHVLGGVAFLVAVLWLDAWTAITLASVLTGCVVVLRLGLRRELRGVSRSGPARGWAEIAYPLAGTFSLAVGWGLLGDRWLAFLPIAFMAWGDSAAGLVRAVIWRGKTEFVLPSVTMLGVCLLAAALFESYGIGALGAIVATIAERFRMVAHKVWGDNWVPDDPVIVATSLTVMGVLARTAV